jgi:peroxiredoxin
MFILQTSHLDLLPLGLHDRRIPGPNAKVDLKDAAPGVREGVITLGGRTYRLTVTERSYGTSVLGLDRNYDGKIEPSESLPMKSEAAQDQDGKPLKFFRAARLVKAPYGGGEVNLNITYAPKYPSLMAFVDYGRKGMVRVGANRYQAQLRDLLHRGDFSLPPDEKGQGIRLVLDVNGNGRFDSRGETFTVGKPFRIAGQTYEARVPKKDGSVIEIRPSSAEAVEVAPPFVARRGQPLPGFTGTTVDGKTVRFPEDFRGKPLLIDFMGLWSNDTEEATPALVELRKTSGLAIVGVGIGYPDDAPKLVKNAQENGIDWPILFDKEGWQGPIAQALNAIRVPTRFLLDGEGQVLAFGEELDNAHLGATLRRHGLASSPRVNAMATVAVPKDVRDVALYREIQRRVRVDQSVRLHSMSGGDPEGLYEWWEAVDAENLAWLKGLLGKRKSWPGRSVLGEKGSHDLWLMVQHCDRDRPFQGYVLDLLAKAVKAGDASGGDLAYLTDRVRVGQNLPQVYGTQLISSGGWLRPSPIEDEANVDKRRAEVGLKPLAEYLKGASEGLRIPLTPPKG